MSFIKFGSRANGNFFNKLFSRDSHSPSVALSWKLLRFETNLKIAKKHFSGEKREIKK